MLFSKTGLLRLVLAVIEIAKARFAVASFPLSTTELLFLRAGIIVFIVHISALSATVSPAQKMPRGRY